jgi:uncharacterized membrane protein/DNA-binding MarR family transcriptional regulator
VTRGRAFGTPLVALAVGWLFLFSLPPAAAEPAPEADLHTGISWGSPFEVASSSSSVSWSRLTAGPDGSFSLYYGAGGLWHLVLDGSGHPLAAPRLLGREEPTFWSTSGTAPFYATDPSGDIWTAWDRSGTEIHLRKTDSRGNVIIQDLLVRTNAAGAHGPSVAAVQGGIVVGYTSWEPAGCRYVLARTDESGTVTSELQVAAGEDAQLRDGAFLVTPDGRFQVVLSTLSGGMFLELDPAGAVLWQLAVPLLGKDTLPAMAAGPDGTAFLAWNCHEAQDKGRIAACRLRSGAADSIYITSSTEATSEPSLAVGSGGGLLICWLGNRQGAAGPCYAVADPDGWEAYPAVQGMGPSQPPSVAPSPAVSSGRTFAAWPSGRSVQAQRGYTFGFEAGELPQAATVRPHGTTVLSFELHNRGGLADKLTFSLDTAHLPAGWSATISSGETELPAGDGAASITVVLAGPDGAGGPSSGLLRVLVSSAGDPRLSSEMDVPLELEVGYRTECALYPLVAPAAPGTAVRFDLQLRNLGDSGDRLLLSSPAGPLSIALDRGLVPVAWSGTATVGVLATVPPGAAVGEALEFSVWARSLESGAVMRTDASVVVTPGVSLVMSSDEPVQFIVPGESVDFTMAVHNSGSSPGPADILMEVVSGSAGWTASVVPAVLQLSAGDRAEARLTVTAPPLAAGRFVVRVLATSRDWGTQASTTVTAVAVPLHGLQAGTTVHRMSGPPGAQLLLPLTATNTGTEAEDVSLGLDLPAGWSGKTFLDGAYAGSATIQPGQAVRWTAFVASPADALAGEYPLRAVLQGRAGSSAEVTFTAAVDRISDLRLVSSTLSIRAAPGEPAVAVLHLRNLGNAADRVELSISAPPGWNASVRSADTGSEGPLEMGPGSTADLVLEASVPFSAPDSWTELAVAATSQSGLRSTLVFRIGLLLPDLSLSVAYSPERFSAGRPVLATVSVANTGEAPARNVLVSFGVDGGSGTSEKILLIPAGSSKTATFAWTPVHGRHLLSFEADAEHTVLERDEGNNLFLERVSIEGGAAPAPAYTAPLVLAAAGGTSLVLLAGALCGGTEYGKYWFMSLLFVPLYSKIRKDDILDHFVRGQVYGYIKANPGEHYNSIKKALSLKNGTLVYHLKTLEREEFIKSIIDGRFKRFYPREMKVPEPSDEMVLRMNHIQHEILKIIRENPGISQKEIAGRIGLSTPTVHYHINIMMSARVINVKRVGRETQCFVEEVEEGRAG